MSVKKGRGTKKGMRGTRQRSDGRSGWDVRRGAAIGPDVAADELTKALEGSFRGRDLRVNITDERGRFVAQITIEAGTSGDEIEGVLYDVVRGRKSEMLVYRVPSFRTGAVFGEVDGGGGGTTRGTP